MKRYPITLATLMLAVLVPILAACGGSDGSGEKELTLAPESALPDFVSNAPPQVKEAYQFAIANPDVLEAFPCYCGCGQMGHESNRDCYIKEIQPDGSMVFENHAFG